MSRPARQVAIDVLIGVVLLVLVIALVQRLSAPLPIPASPTPVTRLPMTDTLTPPTWKDLP